MLPLSEQLLLRNSRSTVNAADEHSVVGHIWTSGYAFDPTHHPYVEGPEQEGTRNTEMDEEGKSVVDDGQPFNVVEVKMKCPFHGEDIQAKLGFVNREHPGFHLEISDELRDHFQAAHDERLRIE